MTPLSFDPVTAREVVGDARSRELETSARSDADAGRFDPPKIDPTGTYFGQVQDQMAIIVYRTQHQLRTARNVRKSLRSTT